MRKYIILFLLCFCSILSGCSMKRLHNDKIIIEHYNNLKIEEGSEQNKNENQGEWEDPIWKTLIQNCEVKEYPTDKMQKYTKDIESQYEAYAALSGESIEDVVRKDYGLSIEQVVQNKICLELAIELVAEEEELTITSQEYDEGLKEMAAEYNYDNVEDFETIVGKEEIKNKLLKEKVYQFLTKHCK